MRARADRYYVGGMPIARAGSFWIPSARPTTAFSPAISSPRRTSLWDARLNRKLRLRARARRDGRLEHPLGGRDDRSGRHRRGVHRQLAFRLPLPSIALRARSTWPTGEMYRCLGGPCSCPAGPWVANSSSRHSTHTLDEWTVECKRSHGAMGVLEGRSHY